jgi:hypothetical protein
MMMGLEEQRVAAIEAIIDHEDAISPVVFTLEVVIQVL